MRETLRFCPAQWLRAVFLSFIALGLPQMGWGQVSLLTLGSPYTQDFTSYNGNSGGQPSGWSISFSGTATYNGQGNGTTNTGGVWSYGSSTERALGALRSGTPGNITFTVTFTNNTGSTIARLDVSYNFEQWRYANTSGFSVSQSGIGVAVSGLNQNGTSSGTNGVVTSTSKSISLTGLSIANGSNFSISWVTTDDTGADNGIAIDDFSLTAFGSATNKYWDVSAGTGNGVGGSGTWGTTFSTTATGDATLTTAASGDNVFFQGTAGTVTLGADQTVGSMTLGVAGYSIATSGSGSRTLTGTLALGSNGLTLAPISAAGLTLPSVISGTGSLTQNGDGTTTLSGANTYSGGTTLTSGTLSVAADNHLGTGNLTLNGGTLSITTGFTTTKILTLSSSSTVSVATSQTLILNAGSNPLTGSGGLTKTGSGYLQINNSTNYTGKTVINGGFISSSGESRFGANPSSFVADQITLNGGGVSTSTGSINFNSNRGITLGASGGTFEATGSNTITLTNVVTGSGGLTKTGAGTLAFAGAHTYTGTTTISAGTAQLNAADRISNSSDMILNGGTFSTGATTGFNETVGTLNLNANSTIALGTGSHSLTFANSSSVTWAGTTLTITGWTGSCGSSGTAGKIFFGNSSSTLTQAQLDKISFSGFGGSKGVLLSTGELVPSCASSDIVRNASFTEPSDVAYASYQGTDITTANSIEVAQFTIRDGGSAFNDSDVHSTTLSAITFSVTNSSNLRRIALYDGTSELAEVAAAASVSFSSLTLAAPDNSSKTFSIRVSFQSTVTDNQQFQFTVTAATAAAGGSDFAAGNAGGAASSTTGDRNRIEVTATKLSYEQQPTNTAVLTNISPTVTVRALDGNNNLDLDYTASVSLTSSLSCGSLSGNTATASAGVASFPTLQGSSAQNGVTLTASSGSLTAATSSSFDLTAVAATDVTLVKWDFGDSNNTADAGISANTSATITSEGASGLISYPTGQLSSSDKCILNSDWSTTAGDARWVTSTLSTVGYSNIKVSSVHRGSNTGPRDWKLQYRVGSGSWTDVSGTNLTLSSTPWPSTPCATCKLDGVQLPAAAENISNLQIRWVTRSSVSVDGGTIGSTGTNAIDEILVTGDFIYPAKDLYYRSVATGDFSDPCSWETSTSVSGPWASAPVAPDFTAKTITVRNSHTITLNAAATLDEFVIDNGGVFVVNNFSITWNNGTGVDFTVNGTYQDNASSAQNSVFSTGATWQLGSSGTFIKTRNSSSAVFRDNYEGGMSAIPATANWIVRYTGASSLSFTTINSFYPNLTFENSTGSAYDFNGTGEFFSGSTGGFATVKGNLDVGGTTYTSGVTVRNANTNATPLTVLGDLIVRSGSTLRNLQGSTEGTGFAVSGNLTINGTLDATGSGSNGLLRLEGTNNQTISGSGTLNIHNLTVVKTGGTLTQSRNLQVNNDLTLTNGTLNLNGNTLTYIGNSISRTTGFVDASGVGSVLEFGANASGLTLPASVFTSNQVRNLTHNRAGGVTLGSDTEITGNLTLSSGTLLTASNQLTYSGSSITRSSGNIDATNSSATIRFTNAAMLTLPASLFVSSQANNLIVNGGGITLGSALTVPNTLTLTAGNILTASNLFQIGTSTSQKGTLSRTSGYVVGTVRRWFSGTNSGDASGLFPIANPSLENRMVKVEYTTAPTTGGHLTASWVNAAMGGSGFPITGIPAVGSCPAFNVTSSANEYWSIENQSGTLTDGQYTLNATAQNIVGVTSLCELRLLKRVGSGDWTAAGTHIEPTGSVASPTVRSSGLTGWSNFGFGGLAGVNPLPLSIVDFWAVSTDKGARLSWKVANARNFSHFVVEKHNGKGEFSPMAIVFADRSDFDAEQRFEFLDETFASDSYYRLLAVDKDGSKQWSKVIFVEKINDSKVNLLQIYPNPGSEPIQIKTSHSGKLWVSLYHSSGMSLGNYEGEPEEVAAWLNTKITSCGLYLIRFEGKGLSLTERYLKK